MCTWLHNNWSCRKNIFVKVFVCFLLQIVPKSHKCGRLDHIKYSEQAQADLERVEHYKVKLGEPPSTQTNILSAFPKKLTGGNILPHYCDWMRNIKKSEIGINSVGYCMLQASSYCMSESLEMMMWKFFTDDLLVKVYAKLNTTFGFNRIGAYTEPKNFTLSLQACDKSFSTDEMW